MKNKKINILNDYQIQIYNEDHTLMNILVWMINNKWLNIDEIKDLAIDFCAYTIPHPSENVSLLTLQFEDEKKQTFENIKTIIKKNCSLIEVICDKLLKDLNNY